MAIEVEIDGVRLMGSRTEKDDDPQCKSKLPKYPTGPVELFQQPKAKSKTTQYTHHRTPHTLYRRGWN
jgi:hypothetical protein